LGTITDRFDGVVHRAGEANFLTGGFLAVITVSKWTLGLGQTATEAKTIRPRPLG
jgi:hypothetical protein